MNEKMNKPLYQKNWCIKLEQVAIASPISILTLRDPMDHLISEIYTEKWLAKKLELIMPLIPCYVMIDTEEKRLFLCSDLNAIEVIDEMDNPKVKSAKVEENETPQE